MEESGLQVQVYYLECLAQATYILSHEGAAFIVDPRRDVEAFLQVSCSACYKWVVALLWN